MTFEKDAAILFAARRAPGGVLLISIAEKAFDDIAAAGSVIQPIPQGKLFESPGVEIILFPSAFPKFNQYRVAGKIFMKIVTIVK